jgi:hypothetical protein
MIKIGNNITDSGSESGISKSGIRHWLKRIGFIGFLFFLIKGILWIILPYLIAKNIFD